MTNKTKNIVVSLLFLAIIFGMFFVNILKEEEDISLSERRKLAKFPEIKITNILNGKFTDDFENFTMDQFIKREEFRKLKANIEMKLFNKKDFNGIYEYNNTLIKQEYPLNEKSILNVAKKINEINDKYLDHSNNKYFSIIPDKNYFTSGQEYLRLNYDKLEQLMIDNLQSIKYIDIFNCLNLSNYYYTDTHWKQEDILSVANKIATEMGVNKYLQNDFKAVELTSFQGVYSGQFPLENRNKQDIIKILTNEEIESAKVYNYDTKKETKIYDLEKLTSNDKYDIYLSGASSILRIENLKSKSDKELIVFRDSFGSSLIPLLVEGYKNIIVVDIRYINLNLLEEYIDFEDKDILFLYSTSIINNSESMK